MGPSNDLVAEHIWDIADRLADSAPLTSSALLTIAEWVKGELPAELAANLELAILDTQRAYDAMAEQAWKTYCATEWKQQLEG